MFKWIRDHKAAVGGGGLVVVAIGLYLAFAVFGVHTLFIDDVVSEDGPVFASGATATVPVSDEPDAAVTTETSTPAGPATETTGSTEITVTTPDASTTTEVSATTVTNADVEPDVPESTVAEQDGSTGDVVAVASGSFIGRAHGAEGTVVVLNDGSTQRFLRFEDDFATDNGPDLFVYLSKGTTADGPNGDFDEDFVNLGSLSGNVGSQNYEIPEGVDLSEYNTVSVWCRRFSVAFAAADLVAS